jgi:IS30 family transposase
MATPKHRPTKDNRRMIEVLVAGGTPKRTIAKALGIAQGTLHKYYAEELELGAEMANARVVKRLYRLIQQGSTPATIFWLKARAGWKEGTNVVKEQAADIPEMDFSRLSQEERNNLREHINKSRPRLN